MELHGGRAGAPVGPAAVGLAWAVQLQPVPHCSPCISDWGDWLSSGDGSVLKARCFIIHSSWFFIFRVPACCRGTVLNNEVLNKEIAARESRAAGWPSERPCFKGCRAHPCRKRGIINPSNDQTQSSITAAADCSVGTQQARSGLPHSVPCPAGLSQSNRGCSGRDFIPVSRNPCSRSPSAAAVPGQRRESEERTHETTPRKERGATPSKAIKEVGLFH